MNENLKTHFQHIKNQAAKTIESTHVNVILETRIECEA